MTLAVVILAAGKSTRFKSATPKVLHDFGENGLRVEEFLLALDQQITLLLRNAPLAPAATDETPDAAEAPAAN